MIDIIEIRNGNWEHEQVNAGFIKNLRDTFRTTKINFWGGQQQVKCVNEIYDLADHDIEVHPFNVPPRRGEKGVVEASYVDILIDILENELPTDVFILATSGEVIRAVAEITKHYHVYFHMIFHQRLERELLKNFSSDFETESLITNTIAEINSEFMSYICYSPFYSQYLENVLPPNKVKLFSFLHHPFVSKCRERHRPNNDCYQIAIYGAAINYHALEIVRTINKSSMAGKIVFKVICGKDHEILREDFVYSAAKPGKGIEAEDIDELIQNSDFVLIPYDREIYKITASGIYWDAIRNRVPVLTLGSPYFKYYKEYQVGYVKDSVSEIVELLEKTECFDMDYNQEIQRLITHTMNDNISWLSQMIHE